MAFSFWEIFRGRADPVEVRTRDIFNEAAQDFRLRELALNSCINMIANAVGRCDFRTFEHDVEVLGELWYRWNVEPNGNQNSTAFLHKLIYKLCTENEALVISNRARSGRLDMLVADSWTADAGDVSRMNEYRDVTIGSTQMKKIFREPDVLHLTLNHLDLQPVLTGLYSAYKRMISVAVSGYEYGAGQHWKVHVDRARQGDTELEATLSKILSEDLKPFLTSPTGALLEHEGYTFTDVSGSGNGGAKDRLADSRTLFEDVFNMTARAFGIPISLIQGKVEGTKDAQERFLSECIDPICDQLQEELQRKEFTFEQWRSGSFIRVDSSAIRHFDLFENAAAVEKLVGSGAYSINELRRAANQPRIPEKWADAHYMTLNIAGVGEQTREMGAGKEETE